MFPRAVPIRSVRAAVSTCLLSLLALLPLRAAAQSSRLVHDTIHSTALASNRLHDTPTREVLIYLPPSYRSAPSRRYPVLYLLHGFTSHAVEWVDSTYDGLDIQVAMDSLVHSGTPEFIVVMPDADNALGGSFYLNSPVSGNWQDFVVRELVSHVEQKYRVSANRAQRALAGYSMGGFGALNLAFQRPDLFGMVYALSPCCLSFAGEFAPDNPIWKAANTLESRSLKGTPGWTALVVALATALSPAPDRERLFGLLPFGSDSLPQRATVKADWLRQMPIDRARQLAARGVAKPAIHIDHGDHDQVASVIPGVAALRRTLDSLDIAYTATSFDGGHVDHVRSRISEHLLPIVGQWFRSAPAAPRR